MEKRLRIALILETSGGGSGRHVLDLANGLAMRNHHVTVIWSPVRAQKDFKIQLMALSNVERKTVKMNRAIGLTDLTSLWTLGSLLRKHGPFDILHGHSSKAGALVRLLPRSIPGHRIYTPHAFRTMDPMIRAAPKLVYGKIEKFLSSRADRIITVSGAEHAHARTLGIADSGLVTILNGAVLPKNANREQARRIMGLTDDMVAVGFIGRLDQQKSPVRFVEAIERAADQAPNIKGVIIGDGQMRKSAEAANTSGTSRFLGWQNGPLLFPGLDIFCMTSQYEAMPYTLLEALHAGVPIVTTAVGGVEETVENGVNGYVLPVDCSSNDIATMLAALANNGEKRQDFGARALECAKKRTIDIMVEETLAVYRELDG